MSNALAAGVAPAVNAEFSSRLERCLAAAPCEHPTPVQLFSGESDAFWLWANTEGYCESSRLREILPGLPDETTQANFTGKSGDATLQDAFRIYSLIKNVVEANYRKLADCDRILDFGCGWGRIIPFFLRDLAPEKIWGIDCMPEAIKLCTSRNRWCQFQQVPTMPPTDLKAGTFDVVYAYSVFSHLSEAHQAWLNEFHRVLKPGGMVVLTTRDRGFIEYCESLRKRADELAAFAAGAVDSFRNSKECLAAYDRGEFCHHPTGGGSVLADSFYGETCIPKRYVEKHWADRFELIDFIDDRARCEQNVIVAKDPLAAIRQSHSIGGKNPDYTGASRRRFGICLLP